MFASETDNALPLSLPDSCFYLQFLLNRLPICRPAFKTSNHRQMKKIYNTLFSAFYFISEAAYLHIFPGKLKGLSQMQPLFVPGTGNKIHG